MAVCARSPPPLPLASASFPHAGGGRSAVPSRPAGAALGAVTLRWTPGTALSPAFGGEHPPAKLESYTAITYKTFIKSHIILSSEGLALLLFFFFSLFLLSFKIEGKKKNEKGKKKPPGTFIWALLISERLADFCANKFALKPY